MKHLVVLSGAGISAESGIPTFRASDGLWEGHNVMDVASPEGWQKSQHTVLNFYNERRRAARLAQPNPGHQILAELQDDFQVDIITQNVDDLHERAGSKSVLHLHGKLNESRSTKDPSIILPIDGDELNIGDICPLGSQLRPNIVWFGEMVPEMEKAVKLVVAADYFVVVGTSMMVYPAAGLIDFVGTGIPTFIVDPKMPSVRNQDDLYLIEERASTGLKKVKNYLSQFR